MDKFVKKDLQTTKSSQEKIHKVQKERGAEQLTPDRREYLLKKAEAVRRLIADTELRQQRELQERSESQKNSHESVSKIPDSLSREKPALIKKVHEEGSAHVRVMDAGHSREMEALAAQLRDLEADLGSGTTHEAVAAPSPEEKVTATSKELMPDVKQETATRSERLDNEK